MKVKDILRQKGSDVVKIEVDRTIHDAICKLNEYGIGSLVVTDDSGDICGIITERDILRHCGEICVRLTQPLQQEGNACPALVRDAMTKDVVIGMRHDDLSYVRGIMTRNRVRHLPILEQGELVGIISIGDVVNAHVEETDFENHMLKDYVQGVSH